MDELDATLRTALRHVEEATVIVARQRQRIADLKEEGLPTKGDEELLRTFIETLGCLEDHALHLQTELFATRSRLPASEG